MCYVCKLPSEGRQEVSAPLELESRGCKPTNMGAENQTPNPCQTVSVFNSSAIQLSTLLKRNSSSTLGCSFAILLAPSHSLV